MRRLMGHLAHFSSFFKQGELLCTQGLAYLLQDSDARSVIATYISGRANIMISPDLTWRPEVVHADRGRPDLEACDADGKPAVMIEAKLGAALSEDQFRSYAVNLNKRAGGGLLLVLVPKYRISDAIASVGRAFIVAGRGPWRVGGASKVTVAVVSWEDLLAALDAGRTESFDSDFEQFHDFYRALAGYDFPPVTTDAELLDWYKRKGDYLNLVDRITSDLAPQSKVLPMGTEEVGGTNYSRRYVYPVLADGRIACSVGLRDPFDGYSTPIWLRFHHDTPGFAAICARLAASNLAHRMVEGGRHIWIPVDVPLNAEGDRLWDSLNAQAEAVVRVVRPQLPNVGLTDGVMADCTLPEDR